nr:MAG TPA: hypothetical protein [Caudoviricetes sp.]
MFSFARIIPDKIDCMLQVFKLAGDDFAHAKPNENSDNETH